MTKLIKVKNGLASGVSLNTVVSTTNKTQCINSHLGTIPIEPKDTQQQTKNIEIIDNDIGEPAIRTDEPRLRLVTEVDADTLRHLRKLRY